ncbi:hypothetical protein [Gemmata sp.]|uniref:hypothetical protein n=1 Tax=Gemmata sp. TaxID=1914242 RepID=UPI003F6F67AD
MLVESLAEWWRTVPVGAEFVTPPGPCGGLFARGSAGGLVCRRVEDANYTAEIGLPVSDRFGAVEFVAHGVVVVPLAELVAWERRG